MYVCYSFFILFMYFFINLTPASYVLCPRFFFFIRVPQYLSCSWHDTVDLIFVLWDWLIQYSYITIGIKARPFLNMSCLSFTISNIEGMDVLIMLLSCWNHEHLSVFMLLPSSVYTHMCTYTFTYTYTYTKSVSYKLACVYTLYKITGLSFPFQQLYSSSFWLLPIGMWVFLFWVKVISKNIQKWES